jgi:hypothetical protein
MSMHRLTCVTIGVPNVAETVDYYAEFGLDHLGGGSFATRDGGEQLRIVPAPTRRLIELGIGVDDADDVARTAARLEKSGVARDFVGAALVAVEPVTGFSARVEVAPRITQDRVEPPGRHGLDQMPFAVTAPVRYLAPGACEMPVRANAL